MTLGVNSTLYLTIAQIKTLHAVLYSVDTGSNFGWDGIQFMGEFYFLSIKNSVHVLFNVLKFFYCVQDSNSIEQFCQYLCHSKSVTIHNAGENDFYHQDDFLSRFYSNFTGKRKSNNIFSVIENLFQMNSNRFKGILMKAQKESNLEDVSVIEHNWNWKKLCKREKSDSE